MPSATATLPVDRSSTFERYLEVQHRLIRAPHAQSVRSPVTAPDLMALRDQIDVFILDGFGVLNLGTEPIPGAVESVAALQASGAIVLVLTNGATLNKAQTQAKYEALGFGLDPDNVLSSRDALNHYLVRASQSRDWAFMAPPEALAHELVDDHQLLGDELDSYRRANGFILLSSARWTTTHQHFLLRSLDENPRPVLCANPDLVAPRADSLSLEPGYYAHQIADATGLFPHFFGKPFANAFDLAKHRMDSLGQFNPDRVAMVGDSLHTDILGGAAAGFKTILVRDHGLMRGMDLEKAFEQSRIYPDYIAATT